MRSILIVSLAVGLLGGPAIVARADSVAGPHAQRQAAAATSQPASGGNGQKPHAAEQLKGVHVPVQMKHGKLVVVPAQKTDSNGTSPQSSDG